jgi:hypothetical protein
MLDADDDSIPKRGKYKGVALHDGQSPERLKVVKRDIDAAAKLTDVGDLFDFAGDPSRAPESRLYAAALVEARWDMAAESRAKRPEINMDRLKTRVAGCDSAQRRNPYFYCSDFDDETRGCWRPPQDRKRHL